MIYQIADWLATYIECLITLAAVTDAGQAKFKRKKQLLFLGAFALINTVLVAVCNRISSFSFITPMLSIAYLMCVSGVLSRGKILLRASVSITAMFVVLSIDYILMVLFCLCYGGDRFNAAFAVFMTPCPLRCLYLLLDKTADALLYFAVRRPLTRLSELKLRWLLTLLGSGSLVYAITQTLFKAILSEKYSQLYRASILSFLTLLLFFAAIFLLLLSTAAREREDAQKLLLQHTNRLMEQNYQLLHADMKENAKRMHDFHHHLKVISGLAESAGDEQVTDYVHDLLKISFQEAKLCRCGNDVIDAILNCSAAEAQKQQTHFQYTVTLSKNLPVAPVDLCAVLGNQIENALEACRSIPDADARFVKITLTQKAGFLIFCVENSVKSDPFSADGTLHSEKKTDGYHGLGIKNIRDTAEKYNGWLRNTYDAQVFRSEVLLCVSAEENT